VLIGQISDVHVGGGRSRQELLRTAIDEINAAEPDLVVVAGDLTDDGYPDQYPLARDELARIACERVVRVPGNHDARKSATRASRTPSVPATPACDSSFPRVPHETADRFQPDGQRPTHIGIENLTDNLATVCGSRHGRSLVGESLDLVVRTTSEN
jgi:predicted MPP superfamily phosphohydrolase